MEDLRRDRAKAAAKERGEQLLTRAKAAGLDAAAAENGLEVQETDPFDRRTAAIPKLGPLPDLRADAFTLTKDAPLAPRVYDLAGDAIVAALRTRTAADMSGFDAAKDALRATLLQQKRQAAAAAYLDHLKERAHGEGALEVFGEKQPRG